MRKFIFVAVVIVAALGLSAENCGGKKSADKEDRKVSNSILDRYRENQPAPEASWSQLRQNLIEIEQAQIDTTQTTTLFFSRGAGGQGEPIFSCPSIGFPIPSTYQLTNPWKPTGRDDNSTVSQIEANGVFTGESSGTYVVCVNGDGEGVATYWEGDVLTFAAPAAWDSASQRVQLVGPPSVDFSTKGENE